MKVGDGSRRDAFVSLKRLLVASFLFLFVVTGVRAQSQDEPEVNEKTFRPMLKHILPSRKEKAWKKIGWINNLTDGLKQARKLQRPILLWTMNGHPLGSV